MCSVDDWRASRTSIPLENETPCRNFWRLSASIVLHRILWESWDSLRHFLFSAEAGVILLGAWQGRTDYVELNAHGVCMRYVCMR